MSTSMTPKWILSVSLYFFGVCLHAEPLSPLEIVNRCYSQLSGERLPRSSGFRKTPPLDRASALSICDTIVDSAILDSETNQVKDSPLKDTGLKVLNNLYDFHRAWFGADTFAGMQGANYRHIEGTTDNFDSTEAALLITRTVMLPETQSGSRYSAVLEGSTGVFALRKVDPTINSKQKYPANLLPSRYSDKSTPAPPMLLVKKDGVTFRRNDVNTTTLVNLPQPIQVGELIGITLDRRNLVLTNYNPYTERHNPNFDGNRLNAQSAVSDPNFVTGFNMYENQGGGIIGLNSFILLHWGLEPGMVQTGSLKMGRRWTEKIFNSLMCRELPVLRTSDVVGFLANGNASDFRKSTTCLSCHATMDPMSSVGRNILVSGSDADYSAATTAKFSHVIGRSRVQKAVGEDWPASDIADFHLSQPAGRVLYRTSDGLLVNEPAKTFEDVGSALNKSPDFYRCATIRYLELLTGIRLDLFDRGDPANSARVLAESDSTKSIREQVDRLSLRLRDHQSVRKLIKELMRTEFYLDSNFSVKD